MNVTLSQYPSRAELRKLATWNSSDLRGALEYARSLWLYPGMARRYGRKYTFITGGWSGNEDVIAAIEKNLVLHGLCWKASFSGGKHVYDIPKVFAEPGDKNEKR